MAGKGGGGDGGVAWLSVCPCFALAWCQIKKRGTNKKGISSSKPKQKFFVMGANQIKLSERLLANLAAA